MSNQWHAYSINGTPIRGSLDTLQVCCNVVYWGNTNAGKIVASEFHGQEHFGDTIEQMQDKNGERLWLDRDGQQWPDSMILLVREGEYADEEIVDGEREIQLDFIPEDAIFRPKVSSDA